MSTRLTLPTLLLSIFAVSGFATPVGDEVVAGPQFQVSDAMTGYATETQPSVAADADGNFVVVWIDDTDSGPPYGAQIRGRQFASDGTPRGDPFAVSTVTAEDFEQESHPSVAVDADGDFVVVWSEYQSYGTYDPPYGFLTQARQFAADGTPRGDQFRVSSHTTGYYAGELQPSVAADAGGNFVVVWWGDYQFGPPSGYAIQGRRFSQDGTPRGSQFQVSSITAGHVYESEPSVAVDADGDFVVVWRGSYQYGPPSGYPIQGRRFSQGGTPIDDQFQVDSVTTGYVYEREPSVATDADGAFVVVWRGSEYGPPDGPEILGRRFAADGTPAGDQFQVNSITTGYVFEREPSVSMDADGDFVVGWHDYVYYPGPGTPFAHLIQARRFAAEGTPAGEQFQVSDRVSGRGGEAHPSIAADPDGNFVVVWKDYRYGPLYGDLIQARQFDVPGPAVVEIEIDIKPGSDTNPINKFGRGLIPVAILGSESFDVADIDVTTLAFAASETEPAHDLTNPGTLADHTKDANGDGFMDLLTHYRTQQVAFGIDGAAPCLTGELLDGTPFEGCDSVEVFGTRGARRSGRTH